MFAQYNQQYQHAGGTTAVSTNGMVWNGNAWVAAGHAAATGTGHSTYSTGTYGTTASPAAAAESPATMVTKYTQYYHQWTTRATEQEQLAQRLPLNTPQRTEAQQNADWAKYYADQASRAAHHYHSNPHTPAPFELPPAPPVAGQPMAVVAAQQQQAQSYAAQRAPVATSTPASTVKKTSRWSAHGPAAASTSKAPSAAASSDGPPDGLKRYVHRCLEQCKTPEQTKAIERETERVIAKALQAGSLHTTNWDAAPLIPIPGVAAKRDYSSPARPGQHYGQQESHSHQSSKKQKMTSGDSYYGPSSGGGSQSSWNSEQEHNNNQGQSGYYGPSSHTASSQNSQQSHYKSQKQHQSKYQPGHYGYGPVDGNQDFIAVPQFGKKNGKKGNNKYVNPNSTKHKTNKASMNMNDGFQRSNTAMASRANRFSGPGGNADVRHATPKGIDDRYMGKGIIGGSNKKLDEMDFEQMKVKGTCMKLEKQYLRLTAPPKPELVRPLNILTQHLKNLKAEWKSPTKRDYLWFCAEMKSMRQDLTVQHISNAFTVEVYEFHARIALQEGDLNEFNQAQTQLKILYAKVDDPKALENENEFVAYLMIYFVMLLLNKKYAGGSSDMLNLMLSLTPAQREDPAIEHALQVRSAVAEVDYHKFFRLYSSCPNLGGKVMDLMVPTMRHWALQRLCKAFKPTADVVYVLKAMGLKVDEPQEIEEGKTFLLSCGCVLSDDGKEIKTKDSVVRESDLQEKRSLI